MTKGRKMAEFKFNCPQCDQKIETDESLRGQVAECPHCGEGIVVPRGKEKSQMIHLSSMKTVERKPVASGMGSRKPHRYVACEGMLFDCGTSDSESGKEVNFSQKKNKERERRHMFVQTYICTHCGEVTTSPKKIHGAIVGCLVLIIGLPFLGFLLFMGALPPIILIFGAVLLLICGIKSLVQGERTKCGNCDKFDTMISVTSPQGRRLFNETVHGHNMIGQSPSILRRQRIWTGQDDGIMDSPSPPSVQLQQLDVSERLNKIRKLLDDGVITAEEYEVQRRRILESL